MNEVPRMLVVGGPNGSGKTTLALAHSSETGFPYLGADAIAASINPEDPHRARIAAGRKFAHLVHESIFNRRSLIVESTLSGLTMTNVFKAANSNGCKVSIAFLYVAKVDICIARVAERVRKGGHNVPEADIRRRFIRAAVNFWTIYRKLADDWVLFYNQDTAVHDAAIGTNDQITIRDPVAFGVFEKLIGKIDNV